MTRRFSHASKGRLTTRDLGRFPGATLFDRVARAVCDAGCLPRKELYEAWEVARRARRGFRGGRVVDLGAGHGLLAHLMLILDDTSPLALAIDMKTPPSAPRIHDALARSWPRLADRVTFVTGGPDAIALRPDDIVVSCHACGAFADQVIDTAAAARARLAVLPCCHDARTCDAGDLTGWMDPPLAIDAVRVMRLRALGYHVRTQIIPATITPKNRLIVASREEGSSRYLSRYSLRPRAT
jgi:hypothetical protein